LLVSHTAGARAPACLTNRRTSLLASGGLVLLPAGPALAGLGGTNNPRELTRSGMAKFIKGDIAGSLADFDKVGSQALEEGYERWSRVFT
jgi:hypothetical protein